MLAEASLYSWCKEYQRRTAIQALKEELKTLVRGQSVGRLHETQGQVKVQAVYMTSESATRRSGRIKALSAVVATVKLCRDRHRCISVCPRDYKQT